MPNMNLYQCDKCVRPGEELPCYMLGIMDEDYKTMPCQANSDNNTNWEDRGEHVCLPVEEYEMRIRVAQARAIVWMGKYIQAGAKYQSIINNAVEKAKEELKT